jgi:uncharacterized protein (TIGR03032 family)
MTRATGTRHDARWASHARAWRDPLGIAAQWDHADAVDPALVRHEARGRWWETLESRGITLLVTREYEHLVAAFSVQEGRPRSSYFAVPHPSGLVADREADTVYLASTRNPNMVFDLRPARGLIDRADVALERLAERPLVPVRARYLPGSLRLHDLALVDRALHANAVGMNAVVRIDPDGRYEPVWWPRSIEADGGPRFDRNYLQLNSIASAPALEASFFTASAVAPGARRPGHRNFPVDGRGAVFGGATREPIATGLTRPHSARVHAGRVWVCNSGYGELGYVDGGRLTVAARLPGWTRGLCFVGDVAFVATSRVIPRFSAYAPGLEIDASVCGVHAIDTRSGETIGRLVWPAGNQVFGIEWVADRTSRGFVAEANRRRSRRRERELFYAFDAS